MTRIYVLKLTNNKYYVGKTDKSIEDRFGEHVTEYGSEWCKLHKPLEVVEVIENVDEYDEDKITKKYMDVYGIENVRGGSYTMVNLPDYQLKALELELCTSKDKCFKCHQPGHFADQCHQLQKQNQVYTNNSANGWNFYEDIWTCDKCNKYFPYESMLKNHTCHPKNVTSQDSYLDQIGNMKLRDAGNYLGQLLFTQPKQANTNKYVWVCDDCNNEFLTKYKIENHKCTTKNNRKKSYQDKNNKCYRCGRPGHWADECYAANPKVII